MRALLAGHRVGRPIATGVAALAAALALAACGGEPTPDPSAREAALSTYATILDRAEGVDTSDEQRRDIETYSDGRDIPFAVIRAALDRTFACLDRNGFEYEDRTTETYPGFFTYEYSFRQRDGSTSNALVAVADVCQTTEITFIGELYDNQPALIEVRDQAFSERRADLVACLQGHGIEVDDDATRSEIEALGVQVYRESNFEDASCLAPA